MMTFDVLQWEEAVRTALGRGGHLVAFIVALFLIATYMGGGQLLENPAKLVIGGFFIGFTMDIVISICWHQMVGSKA